MIRQLVFLFLVCAPNLVLCQDDPPAVSSESKGEQFPPLPMIQPGDSLTRDLTAIKDAMIQAVRAIPELDEETKTRMEASITEQMKSLEALTKASEDERFNIFRRFFDGQLKLYSSQLGFGDFNIADYSGLLTSSDKQLLGQFRNISTTEKKVLIACPHTFLPQYRTQETMLHKPTWGEFICALRLMLQDMINLKVMSLPMGLEVFKSMHAAYPEYAGSVFTSSHVSGDILVLPLLLAQKVYEMVPRKHLGAKSLTLPAGITNSVLFRELEATGTTAEEVVELIIKRIVKYYEKLEKDVFCKIKHRVNLLVGEHSPASIAFNFADAHACFGVRDANRRRNQGPAQK